MGDFWTVLITSLLSLTAAYFAYWLVGKPRLLVFSPNTTQFELACPQNSSPPTIIRAGQIVLQNTGRVSATDVQLVAEQGLSPWGYNIVPAVAHEVRTGSRGEWMLEIPFLGPGETVTLQILNGPRIATVRAREGAAKAVPVVHQRLYPRWLNATLLSLTIIGLVTVVYGLSRLVISLV